MKSTSHKFLFILGLITMFSPNFIYSQITTENKYTALKDSIQVKKYGDLFYETKSTDFDTAIHYANLALQLASKIKYNSYYVAKLNFETGDYIYKVKQDMDNSLTYLLKSEEFYKNSIYHLETANLYIRIAVIYSIINKPDDALKYALNAENIATKINDKEAIFRSKITLGLIYKQLANYTTALDYYLQASQISEVTSEVSNQLMLATNIGNVYFDLDDLKRAKFYYELTYKISIKNDNIYSLGQALGNLGALYVKKKEREKALFYLDSCIKIREKIGDFFGLNAAIANKAYYLLDLGEYDDSYRLFSQVISNSDKVRKTSLINSYFGLAKIENIRKNHFKALEYLKKAESINLDLDNINEQKTINEGFYKTYYYLGNYKLAFEYLNKYMELSDLTYNLETAKQTGFHEAKFQFLQKEKQLLQEQYLRDKEIQEKLQIQKNQKTILYLIIAIMIVATILIVRNLSNKKKQNTLLAEKNKEIEIQRAKLEEANEIKNKLFSIIAHDLKSPLATFHSMLVLLQEGVLTEKEFNEFIPELSKNVESTTNMLNNLLSWTKTQMQGLDVQKEKFDLFLIANGLISLYAKNILEKRLIIENQIPQNTIINSDKNIIEFVLRNIFFNAIKFTHLNGKIKLSVEILSNNSVKICVEDNGIGIPKENISQIEKGVNISTAGTSKEKGNGLGLMLCKDFIENVGGSLTITSEINKGSRFCFTIPQK